MLINSPRILLVWICGATGPNR
ncbi:hypothetical protein RSAG8_09781, partial [Rhizoctonia solani AG-8 WAC10335]